MAAAGNHVQPAGNNNLSVAFSGTVHATLPGGQATVERDSSSLPPTSLSGLGGILSAGESYQCNNANSIVVQNVNNLVVHFHTAPVSPVSPSPTLPEQVGATPTQLLSGSDGGSRKGPMNMRDQLRSIVGHKWGNVQVWYPHQDGPSTHADHLKNSRKRKRCHDDSHDSHDDETMEGGEVDDDSLRSSTLRAMVPSHVWPLVLGHGHDRSDTAIAMKSLPILDEDMSDTEPLDTEAVAEVEVARPKALHPVSVPGESDGVVNMEP